VDRVEKDDAKLPDTKNTAQTKEPMENPDLRQQPQQTPGRNYSDWSNAKGKIKFTDGMIRMSLNSSELSISDCRYNVTSGTADLATFSAGCRMNAGAAMTGTPAPANTNASATSAVRDENKSVAEQEQPRPEDRVAMGKQPESRNTDMSNETSEEMKTAQEDNMQPTQDNTAKPATKGATLNVTGFVNGNAINGTIVVYENGNVHSYSFSGSTASKRDAETLGLK
jgi:hypothetical protein